MESRQADTDRGWGWLVDGWKLFVKNPLTWILLIVVYAVIAIVLSLVPLIGGLAYALIAPALLGGMLYGASQLKGGGELAVGQLFQAFNDKSVTRPMLLLGAISLAGSLVTALLGGGMAVDIMTGTDMMGEGSPAALGEAASGGAAVILVVLVLSVVMFALLFYAVPLVMFSGASAVDAVKASLAGCLRNWLPLLIFCVICFVFALIAMIPFGLGFLVLGPVMVGAMYSSYLDVFGEAPSTSDQ